MKNDSLKLWKLKKGQTFLDSFLTCAHKVFKGEKCFKSKSIGVFIRLDLLHEAPPSMYATVKNTEIKLGFTAKGISVYDQLQEQINRGIIYKERSGEMNWNSFQFI